jgi:2-dehydropantoate 2-reductase
MRFVIYGAGAVGGVIGGRLFAAGHDVTLVARGEHLRVLQNDGLTVASPEGSVTLPVPAVATPGEAELLDDDVVVLAMKTQQTAEALAALAVAAPSGIRVVCAQNGVENERLALRSFPHVYGMSVMMPATHLEPGVVEAWSSPVSGLLDLGRYPAGVDETAEAVADALSDATFSAEARPDIMRWKYRKLLLNLGNAVEVVVGLTDRRDPSVQELATRLAAEGEAALRAANIDVASADEEAARRGDLLRIRRIEGRRRGGGSSWQSVTRSLGTIETTYLNGEIALLGRLHGVPTPANDLLQRLSAELAAQGRPPGEYTADDVLARLDGGG